MLRAIIDFSLKNKFVVLLATAGLTLAGIFALKNIPLDAIPDLSDAQVIIYTEWQGQAPQIVQDQVTYPITAKMLSVPRAKAVRGYSFYGFSFVYVIFEDGTDPYWARSRVLEYLSSLGAGLPKGVTPSLGPDATGVGWAFMYSINSKERSLAELRSMQDWYLKYQLTSVAGVAEVASIGGFVKQYQVTVDPAKLRAYNLSIGDVSNAIKKSNGEVGGRSIEMAEKEFILRVRGYVQTLDDLRKVAVGLGANGVPILLSQIANVQLGPEMRRGIAELNGEGETVGGIVVVRYGANAREVIQQVKARLDQAMKALPPDVSYTVAYDRTTLIHRAVATLEQKLVEESIVVALVCIAFLLHFRSALVAIIILPIAILISFAVMYRQGISSNIMSLGGIAIAIGAMVDAAIIMIENAHKHIEREGEQQNALADHSQRIDRSWPNAFLFAAGHHRVIPACVCVASAGRSVVQAFGLHQDLLDGSGGTALHHTCACPNGLSHSRTNSTRGRKPDQSFLYSDLSSGNRFRDSMALGRDSYCRASRRVGFLSLESAGYKLSAATASPHLSRDRQIVSISKLGL